MRARFPFRPLLLLVLLVLATTPLPAQDPPDEPTVAVLDFTAMAIPPQDMHEIGKGTAGMMITQLHGQPGLRVIERQHLRDILQEHQMSLSGRVADETALQVGKLLGAAYMFTGVVTLTNRERNMQIDVRILDVETSRILLTDKLSGRSQDFPGLVERIVTRFTEDLELEAPQRDTPRQIPWEATIAYSRGLDYEDQDKRTEALAQYREALRIFPDHTGAQEGVARLDGKEVQS